MIEQAIITDGTKSLNLLDSDDPQVWTFFSGAPVQEFDVLYAKVSAVFRALNLKANTVGNMPFTLNDLDSGEEYDNSNTWENKVKFLPNPSELLRLDTLSCMVSNAVYNLLTSDKLGYRPRGLYNTSPYNYTPYINAGANQLEFIQRANGTQLERYAPDGKPMDGTARSNRLIYMWRKDHTTEILPSKATEASAIMKSAEVLYYADLWIAHFYRSGGIPPTAIALKGNTGRVTKEDEEKSWNDWLMGIRRWFGRRTRVYNADNLEIKQLGSSVTELKDNPTYRNAIENIAMGTGMPLSLLLANSANYATAQQEKATWYESDIIPFCNWLAYGYNESIFMPMGLYLEFHPETLDPQQEDETERAQAFSTYGDSFAKYPTYGLWRGMADTLGLEISDSLDEAAEAYYTDKEKQAEAMRVQTQPKPEPQAQPEGPNPQVEPAQEEPQPPAKWSPTVQQVSELQRWQEIAFRKFKRGEALDFEWRNDTLPDELYVSIKAQLPEAKSEDDIKAIFITAEIMEPESEIKSLAASLNKLAEAMLFTKQAVPTT